MVDNDSQRSIHENELSLPDANSGDVIVVAARQLDARLLGDILSRAGYQPRFYSELSSLNNQSSNNQLTGKIVATVLCHCTISHDSEADSTVINLPSQLPNQLCSRRVIVLSDCMDEETVVALLNDGAHHCFNLRESPRVLQARLTAAIRRHGRSTGRSLVHGDIIFDVQKRRVTRAGRVIELSPKEYELAFYLFSNHDRIVENGELLTSIWNLPVGMDTRRIDTAACRVRKKLGLTADHGWELKRLRRIGYRLVRTQAGSEAGSAGRLLEET